MKVIDAHCHLPKNKSVEELIHLMDKSRVEKALLILNTKEDQDALWDQIDLLLRYKARLGIAVGYDIRIPDIDEYYQRLRDLGIPCMLKLHSRIMRYTLEDIPDILSRMENISFSTVMVDGFDHGHHLENLICLELLVAVAERFADRRIVFAHAGGINILKTMLCTRTLKNVYYDFSLTVPYLFNTSIHQDMLHFLRYNHEKVMFGSDYPDFTVDVSLEKFHILFQELGFEDDLIKNILYQNALNIYSDVFLE